MDKIIVNGYAYYVDGNELILCERRHGHHDHILGNEVQVSDLTDMKIWEYNELVDALKKYYPDFKIEKLEGRFI